MDVGTISRQIQEQFPPGRRTPERLQVLLEKVQDAWSTVYADYRTWVAEHEEVPAQVQLRRDINAFVLRMAIYRQALATPGATETSVWPTVRPLLVRTIGPDPHTGKRLPVIDAVFPLSLANQVEALADAVDANTWVRAIGEALQELPERVGEVAGRAAGEAGRLVGKAAAGAGRGFLAGAPWWLLILGGGAVVWFFLKGDTDAS